MSLLSTKDLKVTFLGITPVLKDKTGILNSQEIVALSALLTFKGKSVQGLLEETVEKGQDLQEKIKKILRKSSLKGHASMATTPTLCFSYEASKFLDSGLTGIVFSSSLMASGRRTDTSIEDIIYPTAILENEKAKTIYRETSEKNINFVKWLLTQGVQKDEASKMLQYGIYGTGIIQIPIESIVSLKREYELRKEWMPEEIGFLLKEIEKKLKEYGVDLLYKTREVAPRNTYPYPNIFKNPKESNLVRELVAKKETDDIFEIISSDFIITPGLKEKLAELKSETEKAIKDKEVLKKKWLDLILLRRSIASDYSLAANIKILSSVAWRVWGDKKRHRTVPMIVESVYYCIQRASLVFKEYQSKIKEERLSPEELDIIDKVFSIPPSIKNNKKFLHEYLESAFESLDSYHQLINLGVKERDAIFIIPRGLKLDVLQNYDLYNLIAGYYPLRICSTAEEELRRLTIKEVAAIKNLLNEKKLDWLADNLIPKCHVVGFCLEEKTCGTIKSLNTDYNDDLHEEMKKDLEEKLQSNLNKIN